MRNVFSFARGIVNALGMRITAAAFVITFMAAGLADGGAVTYAYAAGGGAVKIIYAGSEAENKDSASNNVLAHGTEGASIDKNENGIGNAETQLSENSTEKTAASNSGIIESSGLEIDKINIPADSQVLITLAGSRTSDTGELSVYTKGDDGAWKTVYAGIRAKYGMNGLYKEKEGDSKTPVGVFKMNTPFGIADSAEGFPDNYIKVDSDMYWNGDSASDRYNKLVNAKEYTAFDRSASEHLINYSGYYDYCIDTGYNFEGTPYRGSAIFLHCVINDEHTHGCIAIPKEYMTEIMKLYSEGNTYIAIYDTADPAAMYR
jgi:L,D-peptidoglycan transpeptidase YkuD (ErfK/YbiS/YcfS/YnhG family)